MVLVTKTGEQYEGVRLGGAADAQSGRCLLDQFSHLQTPQSGGFQAVRNCWANSNQPLTLELLKSHFFTESFFHKGLEKLTNRQTDHSTTRLLELYRLAKNVHVAIQY